MAADPEHRGDPHLRQQGEHDGHRPHEPAPEGRGGALAGLREVQADVVHLHDQRDGAVDARGDGEGDEHEDQRAREQGLVGHLVERDHHDLRGEDEVGPDRPAHELLLVLGPLLSRDRRRHVRVVRVHQLQSFSAPS